MPFEDLLAELRELKGSIDRALGEVISRYPCGDIPLIRDAMSYALEGGKRLRGAIVLSTFRSLGGKGDAMPFALAMEMVQAYSLVHDDLPCMDDDDMRRGKPTCHKKFGQAVALLTGDALLTLAFETAASARLSPDRVAAGILTLARGAGAAGMVGGQVLDLHLEAGRGGASETYPTDMVRAMYGLKTGKLFETASALGAILAGADLGEIRRVSCWGSLFGYAYQVLDDLEDLVQGGKEGGKDTLVRRTSPETAREEAAECLRRSLEVADPGWLTANLSRYYLESRLAPRPS